MIGSESVIDTYKRIVRCEYTLPPELRGQNTGELIASLLVPLFRLSTLIFHRHKLLAQLFHFQQCSVKLVRDLVHRDAAK